MGFVIAFALALVVIYLLDNHFLTYWKRRNFPQAEPKFLVGNSGRIFRLKTSFIQFLAEFYDRGQKVIGIYISYKPALIINDPVIVHQVLIKDFGNFHDRAMPVNEDIDPLSGNLFFVKGQKWRDLRVKLTPLFTSGKLKYMFPVMRDCGKVLQSFIHNNIEKGENVIEFKDLLARFTINIISSVGFGAEIDCINEKDHIFRKMGLALFSGSVQRAILNFMALLLANVMEMFKIKFFTKEQDEFFTSFVTETVEYRQKNKVHRKDFMDLMIQLKELGYLSADKEEKVEIDNDRRITKLSMEEVTAQAVVFFAAGFETSSSTMTFCLFELCRNLDIQRKVQHEIDEVLGDTNLENITYEALQEMKYLDRCIDETLRKYPIVFLIRTAAKDTKLVTTDLIVEKGTTIYIPLLGIQRDPEIYDDPMSFNPDRFLNSPTGNAKINKGLFYAPFGDGPRNCIGARMGKLQAKLGIVLILSKYNLELDSNTVEEELELDIKSSVMGPREKLNFKVYVR